MPDHYNVPSLDKPVNQTIAFIFFYRLAFVILFILFAIVISIQVWHSSPGGEQLKNCAIVFTCCSVIVGIFYSIINYEHNQLKFKHDVKTYRETLTYNTACKMHDTEMLHHFRTVREFYMANIALFSEGKGAEIEKLLAAEKETMLSFVLTMNYLESLSVAISQGIMDERFLKRFFHIIFKENFRRYGGYIAYLRQARDTPQIFENFTMVAEKWNKNV